MHQLLDYLGDDVVLQFGCGTIGHPHGHRSRDRTETNDRHVEYTLHSYAADRPHGTRYGSGDTPD